MIKLNITKPHKNNVLEQGIEYLEKKAYANIILKIESTNNLLELSYGFSFNITQYLNAALGHEFTLYAHDIIFSPDLKQHYKLSSRFMESPPFISKWYGTRLSNFIQKMADSTYHRYLFLSR